MLARKQSCGHDDGHLLARIGSHESGTQGNLGFAKAHITANQAVHRAALLQIIKHGFNRRKLILSFLIRKARAELIKRTFRRSQHIAGLQFARRRGLDQVSGDFTNAFFKFCFLGLPSAAAQSVKLNTL